MICQLQIGAHIGRMLARQIHKIRDGFQRIIDLVRNAGG